MNKNKITLPYNKLLLFKTLLHREAGWGFLSLIALLCMQTAKAQVGSYRNDFAIGANFGYQLNSLAFVPKVQQGFLGGLNGGFTARYTSEKYFNMICGVQVELNYAQLGWKEDILSINEEPCIIHDASNPHNGEAQAYKRTMNYIQVPLLANLGFGREESGAKFFVNLGPQFGYYLNENVETNFDVDHAGNTVPERVSGVVAQDSMAIENKFDYGIAVGAGVELSLKRIGHVMLEARYYYGLGNIYNDSKADYFARSNHNNIIFKATYLFDLVRTRNAKRK